jgi:hypothetical protein
MTTTARAPGRSLPIRVPVAEGEALDSWLEALARRNGLSVPSLLAAMGMTGAAGPYRRAVSAPQQLLRQLETLAGLPAGRLSQATAGQYFPVLAAGETRAGSWPSAWHVRGDPRFCPSCLAERHGRWPLAWRLTFTFACTRHHVLLASTCPACGKPPRGPGAATRLSPPATCLAPAAPGATCGADLRAAIAAPLPAGDPLLAAQRQISTWLAAAARSPQEESAAAALTDLVTVARWLLRLSAGQDFDGSGPAVASAWREWRTDTATGGPPADPALTGALAAWAITLISGDDADVITQLRELISRRPGPWKLHPPGFTATQWNQLSAPVQSRFLRALDPGLVSTERLRLRSPTPAARNPGASTAVIAVRAARIPQLLWPQWAILLTPGAGYLPGPFRSTMAACLLLPGNPDRSARSLMSILHPYRSTSAVASVLGTLNGQQHHDVFTAICNIAGYLDTHGSPIDYGRRRAVITPALLTAAGWQDMCGRAGEHPGRPTRGRDLIPRHVQAQRYLCQLLTGSDLDDPRNPLAFRTAADQAQHFIFTDTPTTRLRQELHEHAAACLRQLGIDEPVTWQPPVGCRAGLALPGPEPDSIDLDAVRHLLIDGQMPAGAVATRLGTTIGHVRLALEHVPRPARQWSRNAPPVVWRWQQRARRVLTCEFFEREYVSAGKTLRELEAVTGFPRKFLAETAREHGIAVTSAYSPAPIDPDWLREQYLHRKRSYAGIAAELGVQDVTVIAAARRHRITSRPPGVRSQPAMITTLGPGIPRSIRRAAEGSLHGWLRLQRFQTAMAFPALSAAAAHIGASPAALISQFKRLERDTGGELYHRSAPGQPMRPTRRGAALLRALQQPGVRDLMQQHARTPAPPRRPPPARTRPASPRERSLAFYATLTARKIRITPAVRLTLQTLLDPGGEELYGLQICDRTGLDAGTAYPLLARLAAAGWTTSRQEDQQAWQDRNPPGQKNRPRRRYHQLTSDGRIAARHELPALTAGS